MLQDPLDQGDGVGQRPFNLVAFLGCRFGFELPQHNHLIWQWGSGHGFNATKLSRLAQQNALGAVLENPQHLIRRFSGDQIADLVGAQVGKIGH